MNYNRLQELVDGTKVGKIDFYKSIKMSKVGFDKMVKQKSCKVATLEAIARYFSKPISYFFTDETGGYKQADSQLMTTGEPGSSDLSAQLADKIKMLADRDKFIEQQTEIIRLLTEGMGGIVNPEKGEVRPPKAQVKGFRSMMNDPKFQMILGQIMNTYNKQKTN